MHKVQCSACTAPREKSIAFRVIQTFCSLKEGCKDAIVVFIPATICALPVENGQVARTSAPCSYVIFKG